MALGSTLDAAFGVETLDSLVRTFDTSANDRFFSDLFRKASITPDGDTVKWDEQKFDRGLAPVTGLESPAPKAKNLDRIPRMATMASVKLYTDIGGHKLFKDREPGSLKANADNVIAAEVKNLMGRVQKTVNYIAVNLLLGALDINPTNIAGTEITVPTINVGVSTYARAAAWSTAGTGIISSELRRLVSDATVGYIGKCGRLPGIAICNEGVEADLITNTEVQNWLKQQYGGAIGFSNPAASEFLGGLKLGGLTWMKNVHGYTDAAGTFTKYMADGKVIVLPPADELGDVLAMAEGHGLIPRQAFGSETANGLLTEAPKPGFYSYACATENAPGVRVYVGWLGFPVVKFPAAVDIASVH